MDEQDRIPAPADAVGVEQAVGAEQAVTTEQAVGVEVGVEVGGGQEGAVAAAAVAEVVERLRELGEARPWPDDEALAELWARYGIDPRSSYEEQEDRYRALFRDPWFAELERRRRLRYAVEGVPLARRGSANGSVGAALALGFRNVFDPDRAKDEIVAVSERGDGDGDGSLKLDLDPTDPRRTRAVIRRR